MKLRNVSLQATIALTILMLLLMALPGTLAFAVNVTNAPEVKTLLLTKSADPTTYDQVGQTISYSYVVQNTGRGALPGPVTVTDDKATVTCPAGGLTPNETMTCTASYTIQQGDLDSGSVTNIAQAHSNGNDSNTATNTINAIQSLALSLVKTAQETTYSVVGEVIHYSYAVTNAGNVTLHDPITVSDDKATDELCPTLPVGGLAPGSSITCTATHAITQADLDAGSLTNVASATSGTTTSPTDTVTISAAGTPVLSLDKSASPGTYNTAGQTISYSYVLTNTGNVDSKQPIRCYGR